MTKQEIQTAIHHVADMCLEKEGPNGYSDEDLINSTLIFMHVFMDHLWTANPDMTQKGLEDIANESGNALREFIKAATGKDMHQLVRNEYKR